MNHFDRFLADTFPQWDTPATLYFKHGIAPWVVFDSYDDPYQAIVPFAVLSGKEAMLCMYGQMSNLNDESAPPVRVRVLVHSGAHGAVSTAIQYLGQNPEEMDGAAGAFPESIVKARTLVNSFGEYAQYMKEYEVSDD